MALPDGLYDLLLTEGLARSLAELDPSRADVSALKGGAAEFLTDAITRQLAALLDGVSGDGADKVKAQLELVNGLLVMLRQRLAEGDGAVGTGPSADVIDLVCLQDQAPDARPRCCGPAAAQTIPPTRQQWKGAVPRAP